MGQGDDSSVDDFNRSPESQLIVSCGITGTFAGLPCPLPVDFNWAGVFILYQREPHAHKLKPRVSLPEQLMTWRRIVVASEVSSDLRDQSHRLTQQRGRRQAFFFA